MSNDRLLPQKRNSGARFVFIACLYLIIVTYYAPILIPSYETVANNILFLLLSFFPRIIVLIYMWGKILQKYYILKKFQKIIISILMLFLFLCLSYLINLSGLEYLVSLLFICTAFFYFNVYKLAMKEVRVLLLVVSVLVICFLCNTIISDDFVIYGNIPGKFNPNTGAFLIALIYMAFFSCYLYYKRLSCLIVSVLCLALQFVYMSRIALFGIIIFTFLTIVSKAQLRTFKYKTVFYILLLCSFLGISLPYIYVNVIFKHFGYGKIIVFDKDLFSGREIIWSLAFQSIKDHLWFGVGNKLNLDYYLSYGNGNALLMNAHNQQIGILAAFGVIPFIIFYFSFARIVATPYKQRNLSRIPAIYAITILLMSYTDITFFADYNFIFLIIIYALISSMKQQRKTVRRLQCF